MNRLPVAVLSAAMILAFAACAPKAEKVVLKEGTPAFALAKDLGAKLPGIAPDKNAVLAHIKGFDVTAAEVLETLYNNFGSKVEQLKNAEAAQLKEIFNKAAEQVAERKMVLAEARKAGLSISPDELKKNLEEQYKQVGGEQAFAEALKNQGISVDYVKNNISEGLLIDKLLKKEVADKIAIGDDEIKKIYDQDKTASVRHILLLTQGKTDKEKAEIHKKMEDILAKAKAGADFAALAKQYSEDPGSKDKGGLYEDFGRGQMVKPFEDASFSVPVGQISGIVETTYGYHIIKVENRKKETRPFDQAKAEIKNSLVNEKSQGQIDIYLKGLKDKYGYKAVTL